MLSCTVSEEWKRSVGLGPAAVLGAFPSRLSPSVVLVQCSG